MSIRRKATSGSTQFSGQQSYGTGGLGSGIGNATSGPSLHDYKASLLSNAYGAASQPAITIPRPGYGGMVVTRSSPTLTPSVSSPSSVPPLSSSSAAGQSSSSSHERTLSNGSNARTSSSRAPQQTTTAGGNGNGTRNKVVLPLAAKILSDRELARKTLLININAVLGIILMAASLQVCWTGTVCKPTPMMEALRGTISVLTIILIYQLLDQKRFELERRYKLWRSAKQSRSKTRRVLARAPSSSTAAVTTSTIPKNNTKSPILAGASGTSPSSMGKLKIDTTDNFSFSSHDGTAPNHTPTERKRSESNASNGGNGGVGLRRNSSMRTISDSDPRGARRNMRSGSQAQQIHLPVTAILNLNWKHKIHWKVWLQVLICAIHPFPFSERVLSWYTYEIGLLMYLRLHLLVRLIRDNSQIWVHRHIISHSSVTGGAPLNFDWWLSFKTIAFRHPFVFVLGITFLEALLFGHCIYILEREAQPVEFTHAKSFWLATQCLLTGFADDAFNMFSPQLLRTQYMCVLATVSGLFFVSFVIGIGAEKIFPTRVEKQALFYLDRRRLQLEEQRAAARLIQLVWRHHHREVLLEEELAIENPLLYERLTERNEHKFVQRLTQYRKEFAAAAQQRIEAEDLNTTPVDPNLELIKKIVTDMNSGIRRMENEIGQLRSQPKPVLPVPSTPSHHHHHSPFAHSSGNASPHVTSSPYPLPPPPTLLPPPPPPPPSTINGVVPAAGVHYTPIGSVPASGLSLALQHRSNSPLPLSSAMATPTAHSGHGASFMMGSPPTNSYIPASSMGRDSPLTLMHPASRPPPIVTGHQYTSSSGNSGHGAAATAAAILHQQQQQAAMHHHHHQRQVSMGMGMPLPPPPPPFPSPIPAPPPSVTASAVTATSTATPTPASASSSSSVASPRVPSVHSAGPHSTASAPPSASPTTPEEE